MSIAYFNNEKREFLAALTSVYGPESAERVGRAWGVSEAEIKAWSSLAKDERITRDELWYRTALTAAMSVHWLENQASITNEAIATAGTEDLEAWAEEYDARTRALHARLQKLEELAGERGENRWEYDAWCRVRAEFEVEAGKLWMVRSRLGEA